jgi:hypothetical protein
MDIELFGQTMRFAVNRTVEESTLVTRGFSRGPSRFTIPSEALRDVVVPSDGTCQLSDSAF